MQREIKFRQKVKDGWHYWGIIKGVWVSPRLDSEAEPPGKSNQFTGLLDKNGKEIFEGDILREKTIDEETGKKIRSLVKFENGKFTDDTCDGWDLFELVERYNARVIGNVWEHPELLEQ